MKKAIAILMLVLLGVSAMGQTVVQNQKVIQALYPQDINAIQTNMVCVSLKNYGHATFVLQSGVINSSMAGLTCTVQQCTAVDGTGEKTLGSVSNYWVNGINGDIYTNTATTLHGFALTASDDLKTYIVEIEASELDVANSFDCVRVITDTASAHSQLYSAFWILSEPRYTGDGASQSTALSD